ncbi:MAG: putative nucleotidyltransferase [Planctomycetaceae bacterium]|nr:putative nucleotidyltransferase [Planctomycetaceae bacterium]
MEQQLSTPFILSIGTQIVTLIEVLGHQGKLMHPRGAVGVVIKQPVDNEHAYRIRFPDGFDAPLNRNEMVPLALYKRGWLQETGSLLQQFDLYERVIYRCVIGSRAYGLEGPESDTDRRGIYLPPADLHWSLFGIPEQLENEQTQEVYWELQKFVTMALKANPNVLECLYSPLVEFASPLALELLSMRDCFLSRMVYQTFNGYVMSQFKKIQMDLRNQGQIKWKHVMHLIRLLSTGITVLREGTVQVRVGSQRDLLLAIKRGEVAWPEVDALRLVLHREFDAAISATHLPERPDYERANAFLVHARRAALKETLP